MAFLAPLFLLGVLAAAIPIAIHLIRKEKPPKIPFSTLRFFKKTTRKQFLFQRLQQLLLMLLRAAALGLLAFAFARPFINQALSSWADVAPRSVMILMDTSMSMGYDGYLDRAKQKAREVLADLGPGDEAGLILFNEATGIVHGLSNDFDNLRAVIDSVSAENYQATRFFPPLRMADEILKEARFEDKSVVMISDFHANGMTEFDHDWKLQPGVGLVMESVRRDDTVNFTVTGVKAPAFIREGAKQEELFVRVRSFGGIHKDSVDIAVTVDGQQQLQRAVSLKDQSETVVNLPITFDSEGSHLGKIAVNDSAFPLDNEFYFSVDVLPKIKVLVINGEASNNWYDDEGHWFQLAVAGIENSPFTISSTTSRNFTPRQLQGANVVVMLNVGDLAATQSNALGTYTQQGGSILFAPGDRVQAGSFNSQFSDISPADLLAADVFRGNDYLLIADVDMRHPILRPLEIDWGVRFEGHWRLKAAEDAEVLMRFDNGEAALLERKVGAGRTLMFASSLDVEWNNMPLQSMYLPFMHEMLKHLAHSEEKQPSYLVGDKIELTDSFAINTELLDPLGKTMALQEGDTHVTFNRPGVYTRIKTDDQGQQQRFYYAVNTPTEESDFSTVAPADILDEVLNPETKPTQSAEVRNQLMKEELEKPQRLWWWILLVVAALLLSEAMVANRTYR